MSMYDATALLASCHALFISYTFVTGPADWKASLNDASAFQDFFSVLFLPATHPETTT